jgi:Raf kinase inhibitor-like YbhB/YbcL family protein
MLKRKSFLLMMSAALGAVLASGQQTKAPARLPMRLEIPAFSDGARLPERYSCVAEASALRPQINWSGVPAAAMSLVFLMHDSDVHPGRGMYDNTHWIVWNIPADAKGITEGPPMGPLPEGAVIGKNTSSMPPGFAREAAYAPPCAPSGSPHHYWFELFALDEKLDLPGAATRAQVMQAMDSHVVGKAVYTGLFSRP